MAGPTCLHVDTAARISSCSVVVVVMLESGQMAAQVFVEHRGVRQVFVGPDHCAVRERDLGH